jgi:uncharacterized membrane protein YfcA
MPGNPRRNLGAQSVESAVVNPADIAVFAGAGLAAGVMNALAGGGTILTFPALMFHGMPAIQANATSTVALVPGALSSFWGYRREVATHREWLRTLVVPSVAGGALGAWLLLRTEEKVFASLAPWLVLFATLLFLFQIWNSKRSAPLGDGLAPNRRMSVAWAYQFVVAVYGGYFGAGIGILMLVALGFLGLSDIHAMNGLKNFFGACINGVAAAYFIVMGYVEWPVALVMMTGAIAGGFLGALFARRIGKEKARWAVVAVGLFVTAAMLWQRR